MSVTEQVEKSELLKQVKTAVLTLAPNAEITLYGSRARGTARTDSDWDFLILLPASQDKTLENQIKDRLYDVELEHCLEQHHSQQTRAKTPNVAL